MINEEKTKFVITFCNSFSKLKSIQNQEFIFNDKKCIFEETFEYFPLQGTPFFHATRFDLKEQTSCFENKENLIYQELILPFNVLGYRKTCIFCSFLILVFLKKNRE